MISDRLAVYTTVYPGVETYLARWYRSVLSQEDKNFDLWIGVDKLGIQQVISVLGSEPRAIWVMGEEGNSPAEIRQKAIEQIVEQYSSIVFVDSDDVLDPSRVSAARTAMQRYDLVGCALHLIDEEGQDLGLTFGPTSITNYDILLPRHNVFGLSNSVYRSQVLRRCLPIPQDCVLIDWLLATRAWATGAALTFDFTPRMAYRRHPRNTTPLLPPFTPQQILHATQLVVEHYRFVLMSEQLGSCASHWARLKMASRGAARFQQAITSEGDKLEKYVRALNSMAPECVWWWCVAHPELETIWKN